MLVPLIRRLSLKECPSLACLDPSWRTWQMPHSKERCVVHHESYLPCSMSSTWSLLNVLTQQAFMFVYRCCSAARRML